MGKGKRYKIEEKSLIELKGKKVFSIVKRIVLLSILIIIILLAITCFIKKKEIINIFESKNEKTIEVIAQNESENKNSVEDKTKTENQNNTKTQIETGTETENQINTETKNDTQNEKDNKNVTEPKIENENQTKSENQTEKKEESTKKIFKDKKYKNMKITNIEMKKDNNGYSHLKCVIKNNTGKKYKGENVYIIFTDKKKVELAKFAYKLDSIKSGKTLKVHLVTSTDITNSEDFHIEKKK